MTEEEPDVLAESPYRLLEPEVVALHSGVESGVNATLKQATMPADINRLNSLLKSYNEEAAALSQAISLKRIADCLELLTVVLAEDVEEAEQVGALYEQEGPGDGSEEV